MTPVLAPLTFACSLRRATGFGLCIATFAASFAFAVAAGRVLLTALETPAGSVRGKIDVAKFADFDALRSRVAPFFLRAQNQAEKDRAVRCLTDAIYYEAANEPVEGQRAIAQVVVNRLRDRHFPKSVCGVVYEGWERRTGCQFSFVCDGSIARRRAAPALWDRVRPIADQALSGYVAPEVGTATHYHAAYMRPNWIGSVAEIAEIGTHVFYKWKGRAGLPSALQGAYAGGEFQIADRALNGAPSTAALLPDAIKGRRSGLTVARNLHRRPANVRGASARLGRNHLHGGRTAHGSVRLT